MKSFLRAYIRMVERLANGTQNLDLSSLMTFIILVVELMTTKI
ncbi:unnamed protein product [Paramecium primaurelia]|uniref:Uncharacterized protein n=1 Tax=Paramecium primaurelia TaxID=5886 RepID=A0A8S1Q5K1_PARPR|nr:unnamed protein product [Paramecium primaurelia]